MKGGEGSLGGGDGEPRPPPLEAGAPPATTASRVGGHDVPSLPADVPSLPANDAAVDELICSAALKTEKAICVARVLYGGALLVFTLSAVDLYGATSVLFSSLALGFFIAASIGLLVRLDGIANPRWVFPLSVAMDASVAFVSLLPDVLWPWPGYGGMINLISLSGLLISTFASGFRLSLRVAVLGSVLNGLSFVVLMLLDHRISGHPTAGEVEQVILFSVFLFGASALAVVLATLTLRLVRSGARASVLADRARQRLDHIVQDHHDVRSTLTAVTLYASALQERLRAQETPALEPARDLATQLQEELVRLRSQIEIIKTETLAELVALKEIQPVDLVSAVDRILVYAQRLFSQVQWGFERPASGGRVLVAGGQPVLERILFNLLVNACEGDGTGGASRVDLSIRRGRAPGFVVVELTDDGPGFPAELLRVPLGERLLSTKAGGTGIGLAIASGLAQASAGSIRLANRRDGGALVTLELKAESEWA